MLRKRKLEENAFGPKKLSMILFDIEKEISFIKC